MRAGPSPLPAAPAAFCTASACRFLLRAQDADGAWRDFQLPPGRSEAWTTAYVGACLVQARERGAAADMEASLRAAVRFLEAARKPGGWSYNRSVEADGDSSARVILFLNRCGASPDRKAYADLVKFQLPDGHFATYLDRGLRRGWAKGHPDVTAVAMQALGAVLPAAHPILARAAQALRLHGRGPHGAASYWWASDLYLARELWALERAYPGAPRLALPAPRGSGPRTFFDRGLALALSARDGQAGGFLKEAILSLERSQLDDGSWPSAPILRLTDPAAEDFDDHRFKNSPLFADVRRIFTTATVLGGLTSD
ncbi:MAG TPA: prenyltransferase/squalene oxidase repeat-containing protein [bacterium]|jgi:hypothetical protein|nr:prenyltransferase/squalene oxidase repeat-containing protein [bacterium]